MKLQQYADEHCGGDRFRAIYELMLHSGEGGFDPYVDELSQEEADFVVSLLTLDAMRIYGKDGFCKRVKAEQLAASLGTSTDEVKANRRNPFRKGLLIGILLVLGAIAADVLLAVLPLGISGSTAAIIGSALTGLAATALAERVILFAKYNRLRKMTAELPEGDPEGCANSEPESFEEAMAFYRQGEVDEPIDKAEAETRLRSAKKQNIKALLWMPVYLLAIILCAVLASKTGMIGKIAGVLILIGFLLWQWVAMFRRVRAARAVGNLRDADSLAKQAMEQRQGLIVLAMICIGGLYLILAVIGCAACFSV